MRQTASSRSSRDNPILFYVDHTARFDRNTGIQRCVRSLSRALLELRVPLQPVIWDREQKVLAPASGKDRQHLARWKGPDPLMWMDSTSHRPSTMAPARWLIIAELVSGPHNPSLELLTAEAKRKELKVAWLFHDAIPVRWAHLYGEQAVPAARSHAAYMCGLAEFDHVISNSQSTGEHLRQFWSSQQIQPKAQLSCIPLAEELPGTERLPPATSVPDSPLVLCVSSLEPRKNHMLLLKAFASHCAEEKWPERLTLVLAGWPNDARVVKQVQRSLELNLPLLWESDADDDRLIELYRDSIACVYPSLEEGFGLPVAESLWHRRPCLCSAQGALGELAAGGGCLTVNTSCWKELKRGLFAICTDRLLRDRMAKEIELRQSRTWHSVAGEWISLINSEKPIASTAEYARKSAVTISGFDEQQDSWPI